MTNVKSQFTKIETEYNQSNLIIDSLNLATADGRNGLDSENAERLKRISNFVEKSGDDVKKIKFQAYVEKITPNTVQKTVSPKPSSGNGMM